MSDQELLKVYAYRQQTKQGDNLTSKPSYFLYESEEQHKWAAWHQLKGMGMQEAQKGFIRLVALILLK